MFTSQASTKSVFAFEANDRLPHLLWSGPLWVVDIHKPAGQHHISTHECDILNARHPSSKYSEASPAPHGPLLIEIHGFPHPPKSSKTFLGQEKAWYTTTVSQSKLKILVTGLEDMLHRCAFGPSDSSKCQFRQIHPRPHEANDALDPGQSRA